MEERTLLAALAAVLLPLLVPLTVGTEESEGRRLVAGGREAMWPLARRGEAPCVLVCGFVCRSGPVNHPSYFPPKESSARVSEGKDEPSPPHEGSSAHS